MILFLLFNDCCATIVFAAVIVRQIIDMYWIYVSTRTWKLPIHEWCP